MDFEYESGWEPLSDPEKPAFPYDRKLILSIRRHVPPQPFGADHFRDAYRKLGDRDTIEETTQSQWCLQNPVVDTPACPEEESTELHIVDQLVCKDGRGAQLIYDPLYYEYPRDATWNADHDYSREAAAYEQLDRAGVNGKFTPRYYGSWTFDMPVGGGNDKLRPVRMTLVEWIDGVAMQSLISKHRVNILNSQQRRDIMAQAMDAELQLLNHGVYHRDFAPRNVILAGSESDIKNKMPKVWLIDFNISAVFSQPNCIHVTPDKLPPDSGRYLDWGTSMIEFQRWLPELFEQKDGAFRVQLGDRWERHPNVVVPKGVLKDIVNTPKQPVERASKKRLN